MARSLVNQLMLVLCALSSIYSCLGTIRTSVPFNQSTQTYNIEASTPFNVSCDYVNLDVSEASAYVNWYIIIERVVRRLFVAGNGYSKPYYPVQGGIIPLSSNPTNWTTTLTVENGVLSEHYTKTKREVPYRCVLLEYRNGAQHTDKVKTLALTVVEPVAAISINESSTVDEGTRIFLVCKFDGYPLPNITWTRTDGQVLFGVSRSSGLSYTSKDGVLEFKNASLNISATYICSATDTITREVFTLNTTIIDVHYKPRISLTASIVDPTLGVYTKFHIEVERANPPPLTTLWYRLAADGSMNMDFDNRTTVDSPTWKQSTLTIDSIEDEDFYSKYCYFINNTLGKDEACTSVAEPVTSVDISHGKFIANIGQLITLQCTADGIPKPTVNWTRLDGKALSHSAHGGLSHSSLDGNLVLTNVTMAAEATYICTVSNRVTPGVFERNTTIIRVASKPEVTVTATEEGNRTELLCTYEYFNPPAKTDIKWYYETDGVRHETLFTFGSISQTKSSLVIYPPNEKAWDRNYCCAFNNSDGEGKACARVINNATGVILQVKSTAIRLTICGEYRMLTCVLSAIVTVLMNFN